MADKTPERDVLSSLPRTRPARRSARRAPAAPTSDSTRVVSPTTARAAASSATQKASATRTSAAASNAKGKAAAKAQPQAGSKATAPKSSAAATPKTPTAAKAASKPRAATKSKATAKRSAAAPRTKAAARPAVARKPRPKDAVPAAGYAAPAHAQDATANPDLLRTGVQAAEELAAIGITLVRQIAGSLAGRIPKQ